MVDWQITATTIYCDAVEDEVTFIAGKDGDIKCTGYNTYFSPDKEAARTIKQKSSRFKKTIKCEGLECHRVAEYKNKLFPGPA
jgi:hypothetical protein